MAERFTEKQYDMRMNPLTYIGLLREIVPSGKENYTGQCLKVHLLLQQAYPGAIGHYNHDHIITEIDGKFYDITGEVKGFDDADCFGDYDLTDIMQLLLSFKDTFEDMKLYNEITLQLIMKHK